MNENKLKSDLKKLLEQPEIPDHGFSLKVLLEIESLATKKLWLKQFLSIGLVEAALLWACFEAGFLADWYSACATLFLLFLLMFVWFELGSEDPIDVNL